MSSVEPNFLNQLDAVARRARRLQWTYGICGFLFVLLAAIVLTSLLDYGFSIRDAAVRRVLTLAVLVLSIWASVKFVWPAWRYRPTRFEVALRVERVFPALENRLSSAVAFLEEGGSTPMQLLAIERAASQVESVPVTDALNPQPASRMLTWLFGGLILLAALAITAPVASRIALARLAFPAAGPEWPRRNNLAWINAPKKIAEGQDVHFELTDRFDHKLPNEVWFEWRRTLPSGETDSEVRLMTLTTNNTLRATFNNVLAPIEYHAYGGDDDTLRWRKLEVVPAAAVVKTKLKILPPEYTGFRVYESDKPSVTAMVGSYIKLELQLSRAVETASISGSPGMFARDDTALDGRVHQKGRRVQFEILDHELLGTGTLTATLTDRDGVVAPTPVAKVVAITDQAPAIELEWGVMRRVMTPSARIPLHVKATDDLAVRQLELTVTRPRHFQEEPFQEEPFQLDVAGLNEDRPLGGVELVPRVPRDNPSATDGTDPTNGEGLGGKLGPGSSILSGDFVTTTESIWRGPDAVTKRDWILPLPLPRQNAVWTLDGQTLQVSIGDTLTLRAAATDYVGAATHSAMQRWTVVSSRDLESILRSQQDQALHYLEEAADRQTAANDRMQDAKSGDLPSERAIDLAGVDSRNAEQTLSQRVLPLLTDALQTRRFNDVPKDDADARLENAIKELSGIVYTDYPDLLDGLDNWSRATSDEKPHQLDSAASGTEQVSEKLGELVEALSVWNRRENAGEGGDELLRDQQQLHDDTEQFHLENLANGSVDQRRRDELAGRQAALAERFDRWLNEVEDLAKSDPESFAAIVEKAFADGIGSRMRETVDELRDGELGKATRNQSELVEALGELTGQLSAAGSEGGEQTLAEQESVIAIAEQLAAQLELNQRTLQVEQGVAHDEGLAVDQANIGQNLRVISAKSHQGEDSLFALSRLAAEAAIRLENGDTGPQTQADQRTIVKSLAAFVTPSQPDEENGEGAGDPDRAGPAEPSEQDGPTAKDWQVVQQWQESVLRQTETLAKLVGDPVTEPDIEKQAQTLALRQDQLAELVQKLISDTEENQRPGAQSADESGDDGGSSGEVDGAVSEGAVSEGAVSEGAVSEGSVSEGANDGPEVDTSEATTDKKDKTQSGTELLNDLLDLPKASDGRRGKINSEPGSASPANSSGAGANRAGANRAGANPAGEDIGGQSPRGIPQRMQDSARRLRQGDVGDATQAIQRRILEQISHQVQQAQQRAQERAAGSSAASEPSDKGGAGGDRADGQGTQGDGPTDNGSGDAGGRPERVVIDDRVWAQLPARVREHLRNSPVERFLPRYQLQIEQYYQRLSEEGAEGG